MKTTPSDAELQAIGLLYLSGSNARTAEMFRVSGCPTLAKDFMAKHILRREEARVLAKQEKKP